MIRNYFWGYITYQTVNIWIIHKKFILLAFSDHDGTSDTHVCCYYSDKEHLMTIMLSSPIWTLTCDDTISALAVRYFSISIFINLMLNICSNLKHNWVWLNYFINMYARVNKLAQWPENICWFGTGIKLRKQTKQIKQTKTTTKNKWKKDKKTKQKQNQEKT